jgi:hypothetical protein
MAVASGEGMKIYHIVSTVWASGSIPDMTATKVTTNTRTRAKTAYVTEIYFGERGGR